MVNKIVLVLVAAYLCKSTAFGINGGFVADENQLPFVVDVGSCSASIIGPDTLLTAAQCKKTGDTVRFNFQGQFFVGDCENHPNWSSGRFDFDVSLCKLRSEISQVDLLGRIENVQVVQNGQVIVAGFGDGKKRFANLLIKDLFNNSFAAEGNGQVQAGDVGGPLIVDVDDLVLGPFKILGVAVGVISNTKKTFAVRLDNAANFFADFTRRRGSRICGLNDECKVDNGKCQSERDIVNFFERELSDAKLLLKQCLEQN